MDERLNLAQAAAAFMRKKLDGRHPLIGIILGSGLGNLAEDIKDRITVPYTDIPGFPRATAIGHKGNFISGTLGSKQVLAMQGRYHYYEGYGIDIPALPIRTMILLGIRYLFVSNAAGSMNKDYHIGDLMLIRDHINMLPNPLIGPNIDELGPRFPDMTSPYDLGLQKKMLKISEGLEIPIRKGVYVATQGPCYETPAEYAFFRYIGGDAVGMSVCPEVTVARHAGVKVLGMSVITDVAHEAEDDYITDENEIVRQADAASRKMSKLFKELITTL